MTKVRTPFILMNSLKPRKLGYLLFSTEEGEALTQQVVEWAKPENRGTDIARIHQAKN